MPKPVDSTGPVERSRLPERSVLRTNRPPVLSVPIQRESGNESAYAVPVLVSRMAVNMAPTRDNQPAFMTTPLYAWSDGAHLSRSLLTDRAGRSSDPPTIGRRDVTQTVSGDSNDDEPRTRDRCRPRA